MDKSYAPLPDWWESVCPPNLDRAVCERWLRPLAWRRMPPEAGGRRPSTTAERYSDFASKLACLWDASRNKAQLVAAVPARYGRFSDDTWIDLSREEFEGPLPDEIHAKVCHELEKDRARLESEVPPEERWNWDRLTAHHQCYPEPLVQRVISFLSHPGVEYVHYVGYLDDALLKAIHRAGRFRLTGMSWSGAYQRPPGYLFDENLCLTFFGRPPWLEGVALYQEGGPYLPDAWIYDHHRATPDYFEGVMTARARRRAPRLVLIGDAVRTGLHRFYDWTVEGDLAFGILRPEHVIELPPDVLAWLRESDIRLGGRGGG